MTNKTNTTKRNAARKAAEARALAHFDANLEPDPPTAADIMEALANA